MGSLSVRARPVTALHQVPYPDPIAWSQQMSRFVAPLGFTLATVWVAVVFILVSH